MNNLKRSVKKDLYLLFYLPYGLQLITVESKKRECLKAGITFFTPLQTKQRISKEAVETERNSNLLCLFKV